MVIFKRKYSAKAVPVPWELIDSYSKESTIHGIKYLGEKKQHWLERVFWISVFVISVSFCIKNMMEIYEKREEKPVMVSQSKLLSPTFNIPFPAITICPEMKAKCNKLNMTDAISRKDQIFTAEESKRIAAMSHVCDNLAYEEKAENRTDNINIIKLLDEMSFSQNDIFEKCRYASWKFEDCDKIFDKILTDVGICYTFNMLSYKDYVDKTSMHPDLHVPKHDYKSSWFLDKDYDSAEINIYPRRVMGAGLQSGLSVQFKFNSTMLCSSCVSGINGFRVSLHMPVESPQISKQFYNVPFQRETNLIVKPDMIYSSKDTKNYLPEKRGCYFIKERKLKYFKIYSKTNCDLECKADYIMRKCGCVKFSMPHTNDRDVCDNTKLECVHQAELNFTTEESQKNLMELKLKRDIKHGKATKNDPRKKAIEEMVSCNCLPSCTSISYNVEISQTDYDAVKDEFSYANLNIYFKEPYFSRLKRYEIYGWSDFLSNSGGLLGLFMGCSVLSFIEILYHIVLYFVRKVRKQWNKKKTDSQRMPEETLTIQRF
ncbi:hypothetical protein ACKWTF_010315 [Chironomus riparius]